MPRHDQDWDVAAARGWWARVVFGKTFIEARSNLMVYRYGPIRLLTCLQLCRVPERSSILFRACAICRWLDHGQTIALLSRRIIASCHHRSSTRLALAVFAPQQGF